MKTGIGDQLLLLWQRQWAKQLEATNYTAQDLWGENSPLDLLSSLQPNSEVSPEELSERLGPRPFPMHLHGITTMFSGLVAALNEIHLSQWGWDKELLAEWQVLEARLQNLSLPELLEETNQAILRKSTAIIRGLLSYHEHPYQRPPQPSAQCVWEKGAAKLWRYDAGDFSRSDKLILLIPSLVNRAHILDLLPEQSLCQHLKACGYQPILLDWGAPGDIEKPYSSKDYLEEVLLPAAHFLSEKSDHHLVALGYCMGGIYALGLRERLNLGGTILIATPWDFHAAPPQRVSWFKSLPFFLTPLIQKWGILPGEALQVLFHMLTPEGVMEKFERLCEMSGENKKEFFVALEDWVNDGVPLAGPVAQEVFQEWFAENQLQKGVWGFGEQPLAPEQYSSPTLIIGGEKDRIVSWENTAALQARLTNCELHCLPLGHTGLIVGMKAQEKAWPLVVSWLQKVF